MNNDQFWTLFDETFRKLDELSRTKGQEYARSTDRLDNFKRLATELNMTPEQVLWVYFTKHKDAIISYIKPEQTKPIPSEPIEGRIDDAILYLILLKGLLRERSGLSKTPDTGIQVQELFDNRLQSSGEWGTGPVDGYVGYRILGRNQVVRQDDPRLGNPVPKDELLHKEAGGLAETSRDGDGSPGWGDPARGITL